MRVARELHEARDMFRVVLCAALIAGMATGCATAACLFTDGEEKTSACESSFAAGREDAAQRNADREATQKARDSERAARAAAGPECARGVPRACLSVAIYDEMHHGARRQIANAYRVACDGGLAFGCFGAGRFQPNPAVSVPLLARGCELGEPKSCEVAALVAPDRAPEFHAAACQLGDYDACEAAGFAYLYGTGVAVDPVRAQTLLALGCDHSSAKACELLGVTR